MKADGTKATEEGFQSGSAVSRGVWHHAAFTSEVIEGTNTRITAYIDYQRVNTPLDLEGVFYYPPDGTCLSVGAGQLLEGWLNELRFSDGVLPVSAFMRKADVGMVILVR